MKIAYFVHDLSDAAVARRVDMLRAGGAEVALAGFRREGRTIPSFPGVKILDLGETFDGALKQRAKVVLRHAAHPARFAHILEGADVVMARNLEMLFLAGAARRRGARKSRLIYECLDVHRAMVGGGMASVALRAVERTLMKGCAKLIVSAPAFISEYFSRRHPQLPPVLLVENKLMRPEGALPRPVNDERPAGPPWRIGWFGMLRCRKSVDLLKEIVRRSEGKIEVVIRGRASPHTLAGLSEIIADTPGITFAGAYCQAELPAIYGEVHFMWAVDYADEGTNSDWLLPNRIYEGGFFNTPNIAERGKATGAWLGRRGAGVLVDDPVEDVLNLLMTLTPAAYRDIERRTRAIDTRALVADAAECRDLVRTLSDEAA